MTAPRIPFGKNRGKSILDVDAGYLRWMLKLAAQSGEGPVAAFVARHEDAIREALDTVGLRAAQGFSVDYTLSPSQAAAVEAIVEGLLAGDASHFRLEGGAGYGKSFTVMEVVRRALLAGWEVRACATSYVATEVLTKQLGRIGVEARTIASTIRLGKREVEDREEYEMTADTDGALAELLGPGRLLIVDEYSMVGDDIASAMMRAAVANGGKLLVVGDLHQLPPVKQSTDTVFTQIAGSVRLTDPMRYAPDSDLYRLEQIARYQPHGVLNGGWTSSTEVFVHADMDSLFSRYADDMTADPAEDCRMLFYRRADVLAANAEIRDRVFGAVSSRPVVADERLMVMSTVDIPVFGGKVRFYSGTSYLVEAVRTDVVRGVECYLVDLCGDFTIREKGVPDRVVSGLTVPVVFALGDAIVDSSKAGSEQYVERLADLSAEARAEVPKSPAAKEAWDRFWGFKNSFLTVGYTYAMTTHRAQGQTVDRVYFAPDMLRRGNAIGDKLTYVAGTRARKAVHMVAG